MRIGATQAAWANVDADETEAAVVEDGVDRFFTAIEPAVRKHMPNLTEAYAQAYAREFSVDELTQMIAFASSPVGKHYLSQYVYLEGDPLVLDAHEGMNADMMPVIEDIQKQMCAEKTEQRIAAGDIDAKCPLSSEPEALQG